MLATLEQLLCGTEKFWRFALHYITFVYGLDFVSAGLASFSLALAFSKSNFFMQIFRRECLCAGFVQVPCKLFIILHYVKVKANSIAV